MSDTALLERRYRRLLACYPSAHRSIYGEEMIGVLLASAQPGQRRPGAADTLDVFGGGIRVRVRAWLAASPDPGWRHALALTTLIAPVLLALTARTSGDWGVMRGIEMPNSVRWLVTTPIWLAPALLALIGLRRIAVLAAIATASWVIVAAVNPPITMLGTSVGLLILPNASAFLVLLVVQVFALAFSPGPRFALKLISPAGAVMTIPWLLTAAYMVSLIPGHYPVPLLVAEAGIGLVALAGLRALTTSTGRRLILLNAIIPLSAMAATIVPSGSFSYFYQGQLALLFEQYTPPVLLATLTYLLIRRSGRDSASPEAGVAA